jgi:hypothetical protein
MSVNVAKTKNSLVIKLKMLAREYGSKRFDD